ncbi:MAG: response regulator [Desulfuromonas sp.]|nr:response regulator [Desulfuromonas sp.]
MSLVGNLEDLGLGEILQIVSLSRKSGVLELNSRDRSGKIIFQSGQVIRATATTFPENLGDLLLRGGMVDLATLKQALIVQQEKADGRRIGDILADEFGGNRESIDKVVREQIERIVYSFFGWTEGAFAFELGEPDELAATTLNPLQFMLDSGLNPQWLAMEGSRLIDEKRHRGEEIEERGESLVDIDQLLAEVQGGAPPPASTVATMPVAENEAGFRRGFLIVDDDPATTEQIVQLLQARGAKVRAYNKGQKFLDAVDQADAETTTLVIDLIMPRRDGSGVLGGLEMLEQVRKFYPDFPVLVMTDHPSNEAEESVRRFGVPALLPKPTRGEVADGSGGAALNELADALFSLTGQKGAPVTRDKHLFNIGVELYHELGEASGLTPQQSRQSPGLHLLRGMLEELNNPSLGGGIILLILRFASELMNRAVIFLVKEKEIVGLGQFGIELQGESADVKIRSTRIPTSEPSLFSEALTGMAPIRVTAADRPWDDYLFNQFGGRKPQEIFLGPLISEGRVVAVLYGDNLPEQKPVGETEALEIFLSQAGLAMEKALLERRLMSSRAAG